MKTAFMGRRNLDKKEIIHCTSESCDDIFALNSIYISPLITVADFPEESMCESFERKDDRR